MKIATVVFLLVLGVVCALPQRSWVHVCEPGTCKLPDCQCIQVKWDYPHEKPQFVVLSFDDAITPPFYSDFIKPTFEGRKNPDGCAISGTFFVPHQYSSYQIVNKLYGLGFEIGSHSITKNFSQEYWRQATVETLISEFNDSRKLISHFSQIPFEDIIGARIPQLQINNNTFRALHKSGFKYDASWPTDHWRPIYPYTLDYTSTQACHTVSCQVESTPGLWEVPIVDWVGTNDDNCNSIQACAVEENIFEWMKENYKKIKQSGVPMALRISYAWFLAHDSHKDALYKFLDYLNEQDDTYIVSYKQLLDWFRNPSKKFSSCQSVKATECVKAHNCNYFDHTLNFEMCGSKCPKDYPWLGNPLGK